MIKKRGKKTTPHAVSIQRAKRRLGFKKLKVEKKPKLNTALWGQRLAMARKRICKSDAAYIKANARLVKGDEKWFSEEKVTSRAVEARACSPVPATVRFIEKDHETKTQQTHAPGRREERRIAHGVYVGCSCETGGDTERGTLAVAVSRTKG